MEEERTDTRYEEAAALLPEELRRAALTLPPPLRRRTEELRFRAGRPMTALLGNEERPLPVTVTPRTLETLCDRAAEYSRYAAAETIRQGYLPVRGGFRLGLCGSAVMKGGESTGMTRLSSAVLRIGREKPGIGRALAPELFRQGRFLSTLILSPPGGGKTTLLRDLVRCLSDGDGCPVRRLSLIDERGEVAVMWNGCPQMNVGRRTDVLDGCPKALGIPMVLRAMNPQVIAVDEITCQRDLEAMVLSAGCGVGLLATIHAADRRELEEKPLYRRLLSEHVFCLAVCIRRQEDGARTYTVEELG